MTDVILHLVSDYSGQTVKSAAKSTLAQFKDITAKEYHWPLIRNQQLLDEVISKIKQKPGVVLYTISDHLLRENLKKACRNLKVPCISVIGKIVKEVSAYWGTGTENNSHFNHKFDESYFDKVDAIDYTLRHDDGQLLNTLDQSDIIIFGPSRTSKTPTSIYLAYNGFKTANIPYVNSPYNDNVIEILKNIHYPTIIVGLTISTARLIEIRKSRMQMLYTHFSTPEQNNYTDYRLVQEECLAVKRFCQEYSWPIIDVSRNSIEETAAAIMKLYYENQSRANHSR